MNNKLPTPKKKFDSKRFLKAVQKVAESERQSTADTQAEDMVPGLIQLLEQFFKEFEDASKQWDRDGSKWSTTRDALSLHDFLDWLEVRKSVGSRG